MVISCVIGCSLAVGPEVSRVEVHNRQPGPTLRGLRSRAAGSPLLKLGQRRGCDDVPRPGGEVERRVDGLQLAALDPRQDLARADAKQPGYLARGQAGSRAVVEGFGGNSLG